MEFIAAHPSVCIALAAFALSAGTHIAGQSRNLTALHALAAIWLAIAFIGGPHMLLMWAASIAAAMGILHPIELRRLPRPAAKPDAPSPAAPQAAPGRALAVLERQPAAYRGELRQPPVPLLDAPERMNLRSPGHWLS